MVLHGETSAVRIAVAPSVGHTVRWYSISVAQSGPLLWVIPTGRDATVRVDSNAWLEALDVATAVRIIPSCGAAAVEIQRSVALGQAAAAPDVTVVKTKEELDAQLSDPDVTIAARAELEARLSTQNLVLVRASGPTPATIRVDDPDRDLPIPMSLTRAARNVDITAFVIAERPSMLGSSVPAPSSFTWLNGRSDYLLKRDGALAGAPPEAFIAETMQTSALLGERRIGDVTIPSVASEYFARAATYGGEADDLEAALSGRSPETIGITRLAGRVVANGSSPDLTLAPLSLPPTDIVRVAQASCGGSGSSAPVPTPSPPYYESTSSDSSGCSGSTASAIDAFDSSGSNDSSDDDSSDDDSSDDGSEGCSGDTTDSGQDDSSDDDSSDDDSSDDDSSDDDWSDPCEGDWDDECGAEDQGDGAFDNSIRNDHRASSEAKRQHASHRRSPVSRSFLAFALVLLPLRRRGRRGNTDREGQG